MMAAEKIKSRWTRAFFTTLDRTNEGEKYICDICHEDFSNSSTLSLHKNIHLKERPFKCEPCRVSFVTSDHLEKHLRTIPHKNSLLTGASGTPTTDNPRPTGRGIAHKKKGKLARDESERSSREASTIMHSFSVDHLQHPTTPRNGI